MFKAIKDNKIIAISNEDKFSLLIYDEIIEDSEHTLEDYDQYNGEYLLKEDIHYTEKEQAENREIAYTKEVDPITAHIQRLRDEEQTEEVIAEIEQLKLERDAKVEEIKQRYPYPIDDEETSE